MPFKFSDEFRAEYPLIWGALSEEIVASSSFDWIFISAEELQYSVIKHKMLSGTIKKKKFRILVKPRQSKLTPGCYSISYFKQQKKSTGSYLGLE